MRFSAHEALAAQSLVLNPTLPGDKVRRRGRAAKGRAGGREGRGTEGKQEKGGAEGKQEKGGAEGTVPAR